MLEAEPTLAVPADTPVVGRGPIDAFDHRVDGWIDHLRGKPAIDRLMYTASELADFSLVWHLVGVARGLRSERDFQAGLSQVQCARQRL